MDIYAVYTFLLSFTVSAIAIFLLWPAAREYGLLDRPDKRKQHSGLVPLIGGVCIFLGVWATLLIPGIDNPSNFFIYLIVLLVLGLVDDFLGLPITIRILAQCLVALGVCIADNHLITFTGDIFGLGNIGTGVFAIPLTVLAIVTAINAFNMIDGIDGLAASLALTSFISLAFFFGRSGMWDEVIICAAFIGAIIPFLMSNFPMKPYRVKVFLGDAGSIIIGFSIVWLLIEGSQPTDRAQPESRAFFPATALWIVGIVLFDLMSVSLRRIYAGGSPLKGDRAHIHHVLQDCGINTKACLLICIVLELIMVSIGFTLQMIGLETLSFIIFWLTFLAYHIVMTIISKKAIIQNSNVTSI